MKISLLSLVVLASWWAPSVFSVLRSHLLLPSVRITFTYGAFTLTLTTLARVVPLDVVIAVLQSMMAGLSAVGFVASVLLPLVLCGLCWLLSSLRAVSDRV